MGGTTCFVDIYSVMFFLKHGDRNYTKIGDLVEIYKVVAYHFFFIETILMFK